MNCKTVSRVLLTQAAALALLTPNPMAAQTWQLLSNGTGGPSGRQGQTAVLDTPTAQMIVFGGQPTSGGSVFNDVWSFNVTNGVWTLLSPGGTAPSGRSGHTAVYDWAGSHMIVFGGSISGTGTGGCQNDTWVLSNANGVGGSPTWTAVTAGGTLPPARTGHSAVYDPTTNSMTIFGGKDCSSPAVNLNDVWVLSHANGQGGTPTWTQLTPSGTAPAARFYHTAVYDWGNNTMIVFGGNTGSTSGGIPQNDVWVLSNANGQSGTPAWTQLQPQTYLGTPFPRYAHSAAYDPSTGRMMIFGGQDANNFFSDAWVLYSANNVLNDPTASQWAPLNPAGTAPNPRSFATAVYDYGTNEMIMYGGVVPSNALTDTWMLVDATVPRVLTNYVHNPGKSALGDFDGDGKTDIATFRPAIGTWFVEPSSKPLNQNFSNSFFQAGFSVGDIPVPVDYDGDGKTDYVVFRPSQGTWYIKINGAATTTTVGWGLWGDIPLAGDFDGDGKVDLAVFRPTTGTWFIRSSKNPGSPITKAFGSYGDIPVVGDFDNDGKADIAVWRPSDGHWYINLSSSPSTTLTPGWGISGDVPIVGDFDADGKTDLGIFRPSVNAWFIIPSTNPGSKIIHPWGLPGDAPIVGDFDGDKKSDFGIFRPSDNGWYVIQSSGSNLYFHFATSGDDPVLHQTGTVY